MTVLEKKPQPLLDRFYPIVPDVAWLRRIVPLGVRTVQLRMKDVEGQHIVDAVREGLAVARAHGCQLIVNDFWREAIAAGADFVHLGQEDLAAADVAAIKGAGLRLGVSTHDETELSTALAANPDYVALGPVFETKLKSMPWAPQGLGRVREWKSRVGGVPLVAIGGLTPERALPVLAAGADSLAVITDFFTAEDPDARVRQWLNLLADRH